MELLFFKAMGAGLALAAPIGPMALLCIRRTIDSGWRTGFATGAGIATGDALLALVAALGLSGVSRLLLGHERALHLAAAPLLMYLGLRTLLERRPAAERTTPFASLGGAYVSSALLTLANPPTLIAFAALFTFIAPSSELRFSDAIATVSGIAAGSLAWWIALTSAVAFARRSVTPRVRAYVSTFAGIALTGFGVALLAR